jgi:hypothetical protein
MEELRTEQERWAVVPLVDAGELARWLQVSRSTIYANASRFGVIRLGDGPRARLRFDPHVVHAVIDRHRATPVAERVEVRAAPRRRSLRTASAASGGALLPIRGASSR